MSYKCFECEAYFGSVDEINDHRKETGHKPERESNGMAFAIGGLAGVGISKLFKKARGK